ncbi:hypothetical protein, conserved [Babesia ovata]|uniref:Extracellular matrix-binding ebh n=1 Tax=Babesia ovata TaxID=189622 RepID=A0A2H6KJN1_9APIC|nr:uncharacterized protein BOVATA_046980 [Babesia ovata]GBE63205.1 hypothetical protein, conserved [Babesia ovata]
MSRMKSDVAKYNDHNSVRDLDVKVSQCLMEAQQYYHGMDAQKSSNIKDLQNELEKDVNNATEIIRYQRGRLSAIHDTQKRHLQQVTELVESRIDAARDLIKSTTTEKIRDFVRDLNMKIDMLSRKVWDADAALKKYVTDIEGWINKADDAVDKAITKIDCILDQVDGSRRKDTNKQNLEEAVEDLRKKTLHFLEAYNYAKGVYTAAAAKLPDLLGKVTQAIKGLDSVIMNDLESLEAKFKTALGEYVKEQVDALIDAINAADASGGGGMEAKAGPGIKGLKNVSALMETIERADELLKDTIELAMSDFHDFTGSSTWSKGDKNPVIIALKDDLESAIGTVMTEYLKSTDEFRTQMKAYKPYVESNGAIDRAIQDVRGKTLGKFTDPINVKSIDNESINQNANNFRTNFGQLCKAITDAAADGNASAKDKLKELKGLISKENPKHTEKINGARDTILENIKTNYVVFLRAQLHEFATKVNELLTNLPTKVASDADKHYKGFMKELKGNLDDNLIGVNMSNLGTVSPKVRDFFIALLTTLNGNPEIMLNRDNIPDLQHKLSTLLSSLSKYDRPFQTNLSALHNVLSTIRPASYSAESNPLLDVLTKGLTGMHAELKKAYVSAYDGVKFAAALTETKVGADGRTAGKLTAYGTKCAKVFLTALYILSDDLNTLKKYAGSTWKRDTIYKEASVGYFLSHRGYEVSKKDEHNGELRDDGGMLGFHIYRKLENAIESAKSNEHLPKCKDHDQNGQDEERVSTTPRSPFSVIGILACLFRHLHQYNRVSHLIFHPKPKHPSSIYDMLTWLSGLTYNAVNNDLALNGFPQLFDKPKKPASEDSDSAEPVVLVEDDDALEAYPKAITAMGLSDTLTDVCHKSHAVLVAILGHGHSGGIYACDFNTNPQGFLYPAHFNALVCMLFECLKRVHHQLYLLYQQCKHTSKLSGWSDCHYGKNVAGSSWQCNTNQCADPDCPQSADQKGNQNNNQAPNQTCKQHPKCGLKSPLQSFLEDGLQGFLPHNITVRGTGLTCSTCSKGSPGIPCRTPMGFSEISLTASHSKTGAHICDVLYKFCHSVHSPLTKLCSQLNCVLPSAPKTLDQMFAFYFHLLSDPTKNREHRTDAFNKAVIAANFDNEYNTGR